MLRYRHRRGTLPVRPEDPPCSTIASPPPSQRRRGLGVLVTGLTAGDPSRDRLGPHRGDHRHHQHDRRRAAWPTPPTRSSTAGIRPSPRPRRRGSSSRRTTPVRVPRRSRPRSRRGHRSVPRRGTLLRARAEAIRLGTLYALGPRRRGHRARPRGARLRRAPPRLARPDHGPHRRPDPARARACG